MQVEARRASRLDPALRPDGDRPRSRAQAGDVREQPRIDLLTAEPAARRREQEARRGARRQPRLDQVLALGNEGGLALAVLALVQLADQLQLFVLRAFDHRL